MSTVYWLLRMPLALLASLLRYIDRWLHSYVLRFPSLLAHAILTGPYYWLTLRQRAALGNPGWQPQDGMIGIPDPDLAPFEIGSFDDLPEPVDLPECRECGAQPPMLNIHNLCVACAELDFANWRQEISERLTELERKGSSR